MICGKCRTPVSKDGPYTVLHPECNGVNELTPAQALSIALQRIVPTSELRGGGLPQGMQDTPARVVRALREMTDGYSVDVRALLTTTFDAHGYDQIVALSKIPYTSLCEHHLLPFSGVAGVAYLPGEGDAARVVGLSKLARVVEVYARRFQLQERMTQQIADAVHVHLHARGVAVVVQGTHACMSCRGVRKPGAVMTTSVMLGRFREDASARAEVLALLRE